jgi:hypothetical protein
VDLPPIHDPGDSCHDREQCHERRHPLPRARFPDDDRIRCGWLARRSRFSPACGDAAGPPRLEDTIELLLVFDAVTERRGQPVPEPYRIDVAVFRPAGKRQFLRDDVLTDAEGEAGVSKFSEQLEDLVAGGRCDGYR